MNQAIKRFIDLSGALVGLVISAPLLAAVAIAIRLRMGSPVLFRQVRPGLNGRLFAIYKFRTMLDLRDEDGTWLPDELRLTPLGSFLRSTSLDEIPELFNVLRGEMSLVGPRPLVVQYLDRYSPEQARRHNVMPGITGWAQVNGRNAISWEERFALDIWYVDHQSLWLDLKIIVLTIWVILKREGINQPGHVTMEDFMGSGSPQ
jgi:sugar transferase EpsL